MRRSACPTRSRSTSALMFDLLAVAYQADVTRVFTFMMSRELSQRTYPQIGVTEQHHSVSHHGNDPDKIAQNVKINTYFVTMFARFLEKLRATPDGDGSLLDHSMIFYGGGMGNPNGHLSDPLPVIVAGGGVGEGASPYRAVEAHAGRQPVADGGAFFISLRTLASRRRQALASPRRSRPGIVRPCGRC